MCGSALNRRILSVNLRFSERYTIGLCLGLVIQFELGFTLGLRRVRFGIRFSAWDAFSIIIKSRFKVKVKVSLVLGLGQSLGSGFKVRACG